MDLCSVKKRPIKKASFTLIELMVVIVILFILMSLLLPSLQRTRELAKNVVCLNNLKQIGVAIQMYGTDYDYYPYTPGNTGGASHWEWSMLLNPYLGQQNTGDNISWCKLSPIFFCPLSVPSTHPTRSANSYGAHLLLAPDMNALEGWNQWAGPRGIYGPWKYDTDFIKRPGETFFAAEATQYDRGYVAAAIWAPPMMFAHNPGTKDTADLFVLPDFPRWLTSNRDYNDGTPVMGEEYVTIRWRHFKNQSANFVFPDGHAESIKVFEIRRRNLIPCFWDE